MEGETRGLIIKSDSCGEVYLDLTRLYLIEKGPETGGAFADIFLAGGYFAIDLAKRERSIVKRGESNEPESVKFPNGAAAWLEERAEGGECSRV